ncbi:Quinohemoprotein alcohol dehydrogenase ADH-IIG precursor [Luteitalea pratensis]|uniref:Quinohemoprotein alcohol dehydrogenase ADH-IIG n=1 Tax=Luteitalea pratensis TaxID=1855912 RepID=A0A143PL91_LUTPR|nr:PQQ-dependent dehydrogenase, methanol/ethanol family [Luteitalea pratensis]AMY08539.1 Quinohemoprotein alcohol dehydrogenase ADH-IIG precursor [Luteitalea pratensis]
MSARSALVPIILTLVVAGTGCTVSSTAVLDDDTARVAADAEPGNWLSHGRTYGEQRFSPLTRISTETVAGLGLAWSYDLGMNRGAEATPIVRDGVMYVTSAWSIVHAISAKTGAKRWVYDPKVSREVGPKACCDVVNRGVAVHGGKVFVGVIDGRLVALDAATGVVAWETVTVDQSQPYTITGAPRVANGLVYIGNGGAEYGVRGYVSAYDAQTGALRWRFYTVPGNPATGPDGAASDSVLERMRATWTGEWWQNGGGGTVWDAIVYDPEFDQLLVGVGNGSPWNQQIRSPGGGDNLFLASIVALDAKTGAYKWHYQTTPGETWDYTATQPIMLADLTIGGTPRKVAMQAPKNGFFYVINRANGQLISADPYLDMKAAKDTPRGAPVAWAYAVDTKTGRPIENPEARFKAGTTLIHPNPDGGHNWHPMSYSPQTGLVYIPIQDGAIDFAHDPAYTRLEGFQNLGVLIGTLPDDPQVRKAIRNGYRGALLAWDPIARKAAWRAERRGAYNGGTLAVAGGVVFQGTIDGHFLAMDAKTGKELWSFDNQAATLAGPVSYELDGEQYISVPAGYGGVFFLINGLFLPREGSPANARVYTFKLGGSAPRPVIQFARIPTPKPPVLPVTADQYRRGGFLYDTFCLNCHGIAAITGGVLPDLRKSGRLQDAVLWKAAVVDEELASRGMPRFSRHISAADAELIRAYVAGQAGLLFNQEQERTPPATQ